MKMMIGGMSSAFFFAISAWYGVPFMAILACICGIYSKYFFWMYLMFLSLEASYLVYFRGAHGATSSLYSFNFPLSCPLNNPFEWFLLGLPQFSSQMVIRGMILAFKKKTQASPQNMIAVFALGFLAAAAFVLVFGFGVLVFHQFTICMKLVFMCSTYSFSWQDMKDSYTNFMLALSNEDDSDFWKKKAPLSFSGGGVHKSSSSAWVALWAFVLAYLVSIH